MCVCGGGTGGERQTEVPHGFQDAEHEVKHGPLGRTGPLGAATRIKNKSFWPREEA